ncbi:hypothetical protein [Cellulomonas sp. P24]|uniref:hypothetical protein n=1 Tax=Cellulomonas sp. P24 TaxID=2885206 RepID=UPI00216AC014|nr:hypothetical protein [Cellulomonas sp. P24]MCR6494505.1 hypothetical protein [Cellulomonas sp. P24]
MPVSDDGEVSTVRSRVPVTAEQAEQIEVLARAVLRWALGRPSSADDAPAEASLPPSRVRRVATVAGKILAGVAATVATTATTVARIEAQRPENWSGLAGYTEAVRLVTDGFPVLWVPDCETLAALASAPDRLARQALLLSRRDQVLAHAQAVLAEVHSSDLATSRLLAEQALDCLPSFPYPAQSLALQVAAIVTMGETGSKTFKQLQARLDEELSKLTAPRGTALIRDLGVTFMLLAAAPALEQFRVDRGDRVPSRPNRHAVAHVLSLEQYTEANALESVLLAVSVLRQAEASRTDRLESAAYES